VEKFDFGVGRWDVIALTYAPTKAVAPYVERALKPGGIVVVEDRHLDTRRVWPAGTFANNELIALFPRLRVLKYEDVWAQPDWSARHIDERLVRFIAEKPASPPPGCVWDGKPKTQSLLGHTTAKLHTRWVAGHPGEVFPVKLWAAERITGITGQSSCPLPATYAKC
jgi:hypothetical protein